MKKNSLTNIMLADLTKQLALLMKAGVSLPDGLYLLSEEEGSPSYQQLLSGLAADTQEGLPLHKAFAKTDCFPSYMVGLLRVGEEVGRTEKTLFALSRYYENRESMLRRLKHALTYPIILLFMMLLVIIVLLSKVLPVFEDVYAGLGGSLTGLAGGLLSIGNLINRFMPVLLILLLLLILTTALFLLMPSARTKALHFWQMHWGDKGVSRKMNDARFAQVLSMALSSGLPLEDGVALAGALLKDCPDAVKRCDTCHTLLCEGKDFAAALQDSQMLPAGACRLLTLGMRAGTGDTTMEDISERLWTEAEEALENKISQIEPTMVLFTSLLVGIILFSVMLPLMNILKTIG